MDVVSRRRPEIMAGGIARDDSTVPFYIRINAIVRPDDVVLDLGAGRGAQFDGPKSWSKSIAALKGRVKRLAGCDVDPVVLSNDYLDDAMVFDPNGRLPYDDNTFDLVYCDWVLEHIDDVGPFVAELDRVLKPGGWFCARTPNKWGYIALAVRMLPKSLEAKILSKAQPDRLEHDVFPKHYHLNTLGDLRRAFPVERWSDHSFSLNATPSYHGGRTLLFDLIDWFQKLSPSGMNTVLLAFMQKRGGPPDQVASSPTQASANA